MKRLTRIVPILAVIILLQSGVEKKGSFDITEFADEQSPTEVTQEVYKKGSFDITATGCGGGGGTGDVVIIG